MGKNITIYSGDEHRAKIERSFSRDDIFYDVYEKAFRIVAQIMKEMQDYKETGRAERRHSARFQGLGNNILIFCGARGQGKTSAMQSFTRCLNGEYQNRKKQEAGMEIPDFVKELSTDRFEVLDSIDPSAMENDESILRVLISRLFFRLEEKMEKAGRKYDDDQNFCMMKAETVKLFKKCYVNIDYIKSGKGLENREDDLENLSQMGSSAKLKENLYALIDNYLKLKYYDGMGGKDCREYLVVPIDDADLATKEVFRLCEDIRNYLSIPNVIILMAVDYDQLVNATYQQYLKQYQSIHRAAISQYDKSRAVDECYQMAAKYLEKVFPVSHRIDLPQIDYLFMESHERLKFTYMVPGEDGKLRSAFNEAEDSGDIQEQLLKLLYARTGIVLADPEGQFHTFLPHTFRELAHWVKMLYDMHGINCDRIYKDYQNARASEEDVRRLKENILAVKQYFMSYWCENNLSAAEMRILKEIDAASRRRQMGEVGLILSRFLGKPLMKTKTYRKVLHDVIEKECTEMPRFQEAVYIYYTIFLNEWFASALLDESQFDEIARFIGRAVYLPDDTMGKYKDEYKINLYYMNTGELEKLLGNRIEFAGRTLKSCCVAVQAGKRKDSLNILERVNGKCQFNSHISQLEFDIFQLILVTLKNEEPEEESRKDVKTGEEGEAGSSEKEAGGGSFVSEVRRENRKPYIISLRNMIANYDVQTMLINEMETCYENINAGREYALLDDGIYRKLYECLDSVLSEASHQDNRGEMAELYNSNISEEKGVIALCFLSNRENRLYYMANMKDTLAQWKEEAGKELEVMKREGAPKAEDVVSKSKNAEALIRQEQISISENLMDWGKIKEDAAALYRDNKGKSSQASQAWEALEAEYSSAERLKEELTELTKSIDEDPKDAEE